MTKTIGQMQAEVDEFCKEKGWRETPVSFGEAMALLHSEVSEALEAWRQWGANDATAVMQPGSVGAMDAVYFPPKPEGIGSEFADVFIRLLDDCQLFGVDLEAEYERKMEFNRQRSYRHGGKMI